ncbi:MAG: hypothetical protein OXH86_12470 [Acidimicrobiaceae bacterium]|uniref:hypothetical protein n=1 Tax=Candidatus Poriferisodalis multihospitum TaxID=2983191 RepID=UPI00239EBABE|nr:hypothetical protein [Candidatus Poriferisodalis multihospitum]MDE0134041.1 hypothetical protein [Acidimicrobiaceae bacterium]MDE0318840.1 hypothetical protein [Acidimicrobiaceae bacterium]MDE0498156.1 hypothetical protein [Acidimicrobiaceae bacterium]
MSAVGGDAVPAGIDGAGLADCEDVSETTAGLTKSRRMRRRCEPAVVLPEGLGRVEVHLDPGNLPSAEATEVTVLVTEQGCANGREIGDALRGPQVVETDESVVKVVRVPHAITPG